jgi:hypothetical protein
LNDTKKKVSNKLANTKTMISLLSSNRGSELFLDERRWQLELQLSVPKENFEPDRTVTPASSNSETVCSAAKPIKTSQTTCPGSFKTAYAIARLKGDELNAALISSVSWLAQERQLILGTREVRSKLALPRSITFGSLSLTAELNSRSHPKKVDEAANLVASGNATEVAPKQTPAVFAAFSYGNTADGMLSATDSLLVETISSFNSLKMEASTCVEPHLHHIQQLNFQLVTIDSMSSPNEALPQLIYKRSSLDKASLCPLPRAKATTTALDDIRTHLRKRANSVKITADQFRCPGRAKAVTLFATYCQGEQGRNSHTVYLPPISPFHYIR